jgi:hypothetical protein
MRNWRCGLAFILGACVLALAFTLLKFGLVAGATNILLFTCIGFLFSGFWFFYLPDEKKTGVSEPTEWKGEEIFEEPHSIILEVPRGKPSDMSEDEQKVYELLSSNGKLLQQSEIVSKTGLSKVKVTRILNRFEGNGLIERKRKGLKNLVILQA